MIQASSTKAPKATDTAETTEVAQSCVAQAIADDHGWPEAAA